MKYYVYIDKDFIKNLVAEENEINFDIEIMSYSIKNGKMETDNKSFSPNFEMGKDKNLEKEYEIENQKSDSIEKKNKYRKNNKNRLDNSVNFTTSKSVTRNSETQMKYINIEDVAGMKNNQFFYNIVKYIEKNCYSTNNLFLDRGMFNICNIKSLKKEYIDSNNIFININNRCFWLKKSILDCDINLLESMGCSINICGFCINNNQIGKVIKTIAIYIE